MELEVAQKIASEVVERLSPFCRPGRIVVVGSIRRKKPTCNDIDIVLIPNDLWNLHAELVKLGQVKMSGAKIVRVMIGIRQVDLYVADEESWATLLLIRTGPEEFNRMLANRAIKRGLHLSAAGRGVLRGSDVIASKSEEEILEALGLHYIEPSKRGINLL